MAKKKQNYDEDIFDEIGDSHVDNKDIEDEEGLVISEKKTKKTSNKSGSTKTIKTKTGAFVAVGVGALGLALGLGLGFGIKPAETIKINTSTSQSGVSFSTDRAKGSKYTLVADEVEGYTFSHWEFNGVKLTEKNPYTFTVNKETEGNYKAVYNINSYNLSLVVDGSEQASYTKDYGVALATFLPKTINGENSCGWFLDENLTIPLESEQVLKCDTKIYTKLATLDKLSFTQNETSAQSLNIEDPISYTVSSVSKDITGDIVIPQEYDGHPITAIASNAFENTRIYSVKIPTTIKSIGSSAFAGCTYLENIIIPDTVESIGSSLFLGSGLRTILFDGNSTIETIGASMFENTSSLKVVSLPKSVTEIGNKAFKNSAISKVIFENPDALKKLGSEVFRATSMIDTFTLPKNVETVGKNLFADSSILDFSLEDGSALKEFSEGMFKNSRLSTISYGNGGQLEVIGKTAFANSQLKNGRIPDTVKEIGIEAFDSCLIDEIYFGEDSQINTVWEGAFKACENVETLTLSKDFSCVREDGKVASDDGYNYEFYSDDDIFDCINLKTIYVNGNVKALFRNIFSRETVNIKNIYVADGVSEFYIKTPNENELANVYLPGSIKKYCVYSSTKISVHYRGTIEQLFETVLDPDYNKFYYDSGKSYYSSGESFYNINLESNSVDTKEITIPTGYTKDDVLRIGRNFNVTKYLSKETVIIPAEIDETLFNAWGIKATNNYKIDKNNTSLVENDGVVYNADKTSIVAIPSLKTSITLPSTLTSLDIGPNSLITEIVIPTSVTNCSFLYTNYKLKKLSFENNLTSIEGTFIVPEGVEDFVIPQGLTSLDLSRAQSLKTLSSAKDLSSLTGKLLIPENVSVVEIPEGVTELNLTKATSLVSISIPTSVTNLTASMFGKCEKLKEIKVAQGHEHFASFDGVLYDADMTTIIYCPVMKNMTFIEDGIVSIGEKAFYGNKVIKSIIIYAGKVSIAPLDENFEDAEVVTTKLSIGANAFSSSTISSINIPQGAVIAEDAFTSCKSLKNLVIEDENVYKNATTKAYGGLFAKATNIAVAKTLVDQFGVLGFYNEANGFTQSENDEYYIFKK